MKSTTTRSFRRDFKKLSSDIQTRARDAYRLFQADPSYPSLQFKKVHPSDPVYSVRISQDYRAVGVIKGDCIIWFFIGSHADYERLLHTF